MGGGGTAAAGVMGDYIGRVSAFVATFVNERTRRNYAAALADFRNYSGSLDDFYLHQDDIQEYVQELIRRGRAASTINHRVRVINGFGQWLRGNGCRELVDAGFDPLALQVVDVRRRGDGLSFDQARALLESVHWKNKVQVRNYCMIYTFLMLDLPGSRICGLQWGDLSVGDGAWTLAGVVVPFEMMEALQVYMRMRFSRIRRQVLSREVYLFAGRGDGPMSVAGAGRMVQMQARRAGIRRTVGLRELRQTARILGDAIAAGQLAKDGAEWLRVSEFVGMEV